MDNINTIPRYFSWGMGKICLTAAPRGARVHSNFVRLVGWLWREIGPGKGRQGNEGMGCGPVLSSEIMR